MKCGVKRLCAPEGDDPVVDIIGQHIPRLEIERFPQAETLALFASLLSLPASTDRQPSRVTPNRRFLRKILRVRKHSELRQGLPESFDAGSDHRRSERRKAEHTTAPPIRLLHLL